MFVPNQPAQTASTFTLQHVALKSLIKTNLDSEITWKASLPPESPQRSCALVVWSIIAQAQISVGAQAVDSERAAMRVVTGDKNILRVSIICANRRR
jgi:hypothetical protein